MTIVENGKGNGSGPIVAKMHSDPGTEGEISDIRKVAAPLGLREYWYPAVQASKVKKSKPYSLKMLGDELVLFRDKNNEVAALWNVCPHRGGSLAHGDCHFPGTVACPYHGWTFDGEGNVLAVLPEGPDSKIPGKVKAKKYPTVTLKGMVFIWMGEEEAAPMEEDIPPEFFDDYTLILPSEEYWPVNWQVALENGEDAHVPYVHANAIRTLMFPMPQAGPMGGRNKIVNGRAVVPQRGYSPASPMKAKQYYFPGLGYWPKHTWRYKWAWLFAWAKKRAVSAPDWDAPDEWKRGHHLPSMYRNDHKTDMYTRYAIPVTEDLSRQIYFKSVRPKSALGRVYERIHFRLYGRWMQVSNFSAQDAKAIIPQRYDTPEYLSSTDSHQVVWRRLILQARGMMKKEEVIALPETEAETFGFKRQEEAGKEPERLESLMSG